MISSDRSEKRSAPRRRVTLTAHCQIGSRYGRTPVADISSQGLFLETKEIAKQGTPVRVALALPYSDGPRFCTLAGQVARIDRTTEGRLRGLGVSLEGISPVDRATLETYLATR